MTNGRVRKTNRSGARRGAAVALALLCLFAAALMPRPRASTARAHDGASAAAAASALLEVGGESREAERPREAPAELKIVSYNIRYRVGDELEELAGLLRDDPEIGGAHVIGLQEVDRNKKRTGNVNTVRRLAESLGMRYAWAAPPASEEGGEEETGCAILSPLPLSDATRIVLTHEGPNGRRRVAVGATLHAGERRLRVYSVHAETRMPLEKKVEHWRAVLEDLRLHPKVDGVVVLGDFNTIKGKDVKAARRLFAGEGFSAPHADDQKTWKTLVFKLKLDWLWLRGLEARSHGIDKRVGLSDHWPLWATVKLNSR